MGLGRGESWPVLPARRPREQEPGRHTPNPLPALPTHASCLGPKHGREPTLPCLVTRHNTPHWKLFVLPTPHPKPVLVYLGC